MFWNTFLWILVYSNNLLGVNGHCIDIHSHIVSQGLHYVPGPNSCTLCICDKGSPKWCKSVLCSQPQNCKSFQRGNSCCDFKCLDDILTANDTYKDTYDLALRLIASAVFAILTLSLLFFVIHRFRRRKLRIRQNHQLSEDQRSLNSIGYIAGSLGYLPSNIGYLGTGNNDLEFHYEEPNNHFTLWKPPGNYFPRGEAPPPYEEAVRSSHIENTLMNNQIILQSSSNSNSQQSNQFSQPEPNVQHISSQANNNQEYVNMNQTELPAPLNSINKACDNNSHTVHSQLKHFNQNKYKKTATEKSKSCENIISNKNERPTTSTDCRQTRPTEPKSSKYHKYENVVIKHSTFPAKELLPVKKVDKSKQDIEDPNKFPYYANIDTCFTNMRHRTIPNLPEYQSVKNLLAKRKENAPYKPKTELNKSHFGELSESNLKNLVDAKEQKQMPLHRTLPKNLKELGTPLSQMTPNEKYDKIKEDKYFHRTLPKHLNTLDVNLALNLINPQLSNELFKDNVQIREPESQACGSSMEAKHEDKNALKHDALNFISYHCLSSQDEDDYRSECENCKSTEIVNLEDDEGDVFNETMTLQRRPLEAGEELPYYRTSLTLPTQIKRPKTITPNATRDSWFMAMQETSSSEESD